MEVVAAIQFQSMPQVHMGHLGRFWASVEAEFPHAEVQSPIDAVIELPQGSTVMQTIQVGIGSPPVPQGRLILMNESRTQVLQVQHNMFVHAWRRGDQPYPRFDAVEAATIRNLGRYAAFLTKAGLPDMVPAQCEVTYVNHISPDSEWATHDQLDRIVTFWSGSTNGDFLSAPEGIQIAQRYSFNRSGAFAGRLHVNLQTAFRQPDAVPLYVLQLSARGAPAEPTVDGAREMLQLAHLQIVRGFESITQEAIQVNSWRKQ